MDVKEKLVELLRNAKAAMKSENLYCDIARNMFVVDFMMANGVTVQECGNWKYYHKQNKAVCTSCSFERDLDANFGNAIACPNCGAYMQKLPKGE